MFGVMMRKSWEEAGEVPRGDFAAQIRIEKIKKIKKITKMFGVMIRKSLEEAGELPRGDFAAQAGGRFSSIAMQCNVYFNFHTR